MTILVMNDLFDLYVNECVPELQPRSRRDYLNIIGILRNTFGAKAPAEVKPRHVAEFINVKKGRIHRNRMVTILSTVFKKAMGRWCLDMDLTNPCTVVERWPTKPRTRYVTDQEFQAFRATACPSVQIAMDLALLTGQRQGDLVGLTWKQIKDSSPDKADWYIEIVQGKTGKHLGISLSKAIEDVLDRAALHNPSGEHIIRTQFGKRYTEDGFRAMWQRYMRSWVKAGNENFHFHDIRAKSISDNKNLDDAYLLAGHIDIKMTRRVYDRNMRHVKPLR